MHRIPAFCSLFPLHHRAILSTSAYRLVHPKRPSLRKISCRAHDDSLTFNLEQEMEQARREARPYNIDKTKLTPAQRQQLRLRSKAIPIVVDKDPIEVIFEDDRFLVVNKPSHLKMHPSHRFEGGSLLNRAVGYCGFEPMLLHRLDMHTTGVLNESFGFEHLPATKQRRLCKPMMKQFMGGTVKKEYLCIVDGIREEAVSESFLVDAPIQRHPQVSFMREVGTCGEDSKPAQTVYTVVDKSEETNMMLLHGAPITGRTHQIRVHAQHCSIPIVGDDLYNIKEHSMYSSYEEISAAARDVSLGRYGDDNPLRSGLKLHARKISFSDPDDGKPLQFCAPLPEHMRKLLHWSGMAVPEGK